MDANNWTLFDKIMYGGLGYSAFCLPTDFFKVIVAILFPPMGELINILEDTITDTFPFITWESVKKLCTYTTLNTIVYSFLLTTLFYIPGLVYTLTNIVEKQRKINYDVQGQTIYESYDIYGEPVRITKTTINNILYVKEISVNGAKTIFQKSITKITDEERKAIDNINKTGKTALDALSDLESSIESGFVKTGENISSGIGRLGNLF
jgi:uncharacterized membrane protein YqaE (UPF0057 family)